MSMDVQTCPQRDRWMAAGLWKVFLTVVESLESEDSMLSGSRFGNPTVLENIFKPLGLVSLSARQS